MEKREKELLEKLQAKAFAESGLDDIDHKQLTRLIKKADAEEALLITGESRDKVIFTPEPGVSVLFFSRLRK